MENKIEFKELKIEVDRTDSVFFDWDGNVIYSKNIVMLTTLYNGIIKQFTESSRYGRSSFNALVKIKQRVQDFCQKINAEFDYTELDNVIKTELNRRINERGN